MPFLCKKEKKVKKALTDQGPTVQNSEKPECIQNLFTLMDVVSKPETIAFFEEQWNNCSIRYGDLKKQLAADIIEATNPIRERIAELDAHPEFLRKAVARGKEEAQESARKTIREVREIMGFKSF